MNILAIEAGPVATNAYLIVDTESNTAAVVDAPMGSAEWLYEQAQEQGATITALWLTHSHWDHTADIVKLRKLTGAPIYLHPDDEYRLLDPNAHTVFPMPFHFEAAKADAYVQHGDMLHLGSLAFEVRHTPGHTEGSVCFICHEQKAAFVGDSLFAGSVGRTDLPGGNTHTLLASIHRELLSLPDDYTCYAGHMDITTIGEERISNPFLQGELIL